MLRQRKPGGISWLNLARRFARPVVARGEFPWAPLPDRPLSNARGATAPEKCKLEASDRVSATMVSIRFGLPRRRSSKEELGSREDDARMSLTKPRLMSRSEQTAQSSSCPDLSAARYVQWQDPPISPHTRLTELSSDRQGSVVLRWLGQRIAEYLTKEIPNTSHRHRRTLPDAARSRCGGQLREVSARCSLRHCATCSLCRYLRPCVVVR
jgi:hypothetical protein